MVEIDVYKVDGYEYFTHDEKLANEFDKTMLQYKYHVVPKEYDSREEYLEECAENLSDDLGLEHSEQRVYEYLSQKEYDEYLDACENGYKGKLRRRRFW